MILGEIPLFVLLGSAIIILWFTTRAILQGKKTRLFHPFFLIFFTFCFIAGGLFTNQGSWITNSWTYIMSIAVNVLYFIFLWRGNNAKRNRLR